MLRKTRSNETCTSDGPQYSVSLNFHKIQNWKNPAVILNSQTLNLHALGYDFIVVEGAARVEAAPLGHVRGGYLLLQGLVDEAAVLAVYETGPQDHGGADHHGTATATLGQADDQVRRQQEDGYGDKGAHHEGP